MLRFNFAVLVLVQLLCLRLEFAAQTQVKETRRGTATVSGQVVLNGAPLGGVMVVLRPERPTSPEEAKGLQVQSDDDGNYRITGAVVIEGPNDPAVSAKLSQLQIVGSYGREKNSIQHWEPAKLNADGSFHIKGLQSGKAHLSLVINPTLGGFFVKRVERNGVPQPDGIEISPGENLSNVRMIVEHGNLTLRGEVKIIGGNLPPGRGIRINAIPLNGSPARTRGANVDARGQFIIENLLPGEYEARLISMIYQPGEPRDNALSKLISSVRQKVSLGGANQAPITLVVDLSRKEGGQ